MVEVAESAVPASEADAPTDRAAGQVIVCGADHLGIRVVQELQLRDEQVVLVAPAGELTFELERLRASGLCVATSGMTTYCARPAWPVLPRLS